MLYQVHKDCEFGATLGDHSLIYLKMGCQAMSAARKFLRISSGAVILEFYARDLRNDESPPPACAPKYT